MQIVKLLSALIIILFMSVVTLWADQLTHVKRSMVGIVVSVYDGDTLQVATDDGTKLRVRLAWIDAPEIAKPNSAIPGQPYGDEAALYLRNMILGKRITVHIVDIDKYKRMVAMIVQNNKDINTVMLEAGLAEAYREYLVEPYKSTYMAAEKKARMERRGIWSQGDSYVRPSDFRRQQRNR